MASGIAVRLPLLESDEFGPYGLITDYVELARQNFKMLLLTAPGERVMNPDFGIGLKTYFFEMNSPAVYGEINDKILAQTKRYMDYIEINKIDFKVPEDNPDLFPSTISVWIHFTIVPLRKTTMLQIDFEN